MEYKQEYPFCVCQRVIKMSLQIEYTAAISTRFANVQYSYLEDGLNDAPSVII